MLRGCRLFVDAVLVPPYAQSPTVLTQTYLPGMICARGVSLIESGGAIKVKTHNECRDAKWPAPIALCIALKGKVTTTTA